ncbi:hypothetical protein [Streptomyces sp. N2A]|uniref:hypothetical protein n=1 Tax=Streptomyces sp. N2A TaxID=3073936 RepID=UPI0028709977|nr:hypothetical protein [Streptomyces sp. N2A]
MTKPVVVFPEHRISTTEIRKEMEESAKGSPYLERVLNMGTGVETRHFVAPLDVIARPGSVEERNAVGLTGMQQLSTRAATAALEHAGFAGHEIDALITSVTTVQSLPGEDVRLCNDATVGLRPDIVRMPHTQLGCVGGAHILAQAARLADATGMRILAVIPEALSTVYQPGDTSLTGLLWRQIFGDSASACVIAPSTRRDLKPPRGTCLEITDGWQYVVTGTMNTYELGFKADGAHFISKAGAQKAVQKLKDPLWNWLARAEPDWRPETVIAHAGGPEVLRNIATILGFPAEPCHADSPLTEAWTSLRDRGNLGGGSVMHSLHLKAQRPPRSGSDTLLLALGPGLTGAAVKGVWLDAPENHSA